MSNHTISGESIVTEAHCIAVIEDDGGYEAPSEQRKANAAIIAAAPDLLAFIQDCANDRDGRISPGLQSKALELLKEKGLS